MAKAQLIGEHIDPKEIQIAITLWKVNTGEPQYKLAEELGIRPDFLSQIAHGIRPGHQHAPVIKQLAEQAAGRRTGE